MAIRAIQRNEKPVLPGHANDTATEPRPPGSGSGFSGERSYVLSAPASIKHFFIPAKLMRVDSSGVPPPRQCVSKLTA
jgi:hypothetical protein